MPETSAEKPNSTPVLPRPPPSRIAPMYMLLLFILVTIGGYFLVKKLMQMSAIQDCVMAGRRNCAPIDVDSP